MSAVDWKRVVAVVVGVCVVSPAAPLLFYIAGAARLAAAQTVE